MREDCFEGPRVAKTSPSSLASDARRGLGARPRSIPPKHFYDARGSALFDQICELPEYYLTRAEHALLARHAPDIAARACANELVELGSGMARKTGHLLRAMSAASTPTTYVPFDIDPTAIEASARALVAEVPELRVRGVVGEFPRDVARLAEGASPGPRLFAFLGSTIGNLDEQEAPALLREIAKVMRPQDRFLLGADRVKSPATLHAAYDDAAGVTAAFNKNVLRVVNRELDGDFDEAAFDHRAVYEERLARIEMYLVSKKRQRVRLRAIEMTLDLDAGEAILTEISRKFTRESLGATLRQGNMREEAFYTGDDDAFALVLARTAD